jgi:hypothetical protein
MDWLRIFSLEQCASIATIVTGIAAVFAAAYAVVQVKLYRNYQLEALARDQYQRFLELCVSFPEYASPELKVDVDAQTFAGDHIKFIQYEWFFTAGSNCLEAIYTAVGDRIFWRNSITSVLIEHKDYLMSQRYMELQRPTGDPKFENFIDVAFQRKDVPTLGTEKVNTTEHPHAP